MEIVDKGKKLINLFKSIKTRPEEILELKSITKTISPIEEKQLQENKLTLPEEYKSILNNKSLTSKHALVYLKNRGITENDIIKICEIVNRFV